MNKLKSMSQNTKREEDSPTFVKPLVSIITPAYNEAEIIEKNLDIITGYMKTLEELYRWELIIVNDGSIDETGEIAERFAGGSNNIRVLHHYVNFNLGQALKYAFNNSRGDYVVVMDMDLSYSTEHIGSLLEAITKKRAKVVVASPYMKGGSVANVPWSREFLSRMANKLLSYTSKGNLATLTGMVRAYDGKFIRSLDLRSMDVAINAEIIYKAMLLRARIIEIPAVLSWNPPKEPNLKRKSSIKIGRSIMAYLLSGFIFRPFIFFIFPGMVLLVLAVFSFSWSLIHTFNYMAGLPLSMGSFWIRLSAGVAMSFQQAPHTFFIGGIALMSAIQLVSLGVLSLQNKRNFEELFHLGSSIYKINREGRFPE